jgi:hypothetical protein
MGGGPSIAVQSSGICRSRRDRADLGTVCTVVGATMVP